MRTVVSIIGTSSDHGQYEPEGRPKEAPEGAKAGGDLATMLADAKGALAKSRDYTCTFSLTGFWSRPK